MLVRCDHLDAEDQSVVFENIREGPEDKAGVEARIGAEQCLFRGVHSRRTYQQELWFIDCTFSSTFLALFHPHERSAPLEAGWRYSGRISWGSMFYPSPFAERTELRFGPALYITGSSGTMSYWYTWGRKV